MTLGEIDEMANNILMSGALYAALALGDTAEKLDCEIVYDNGIATNQLLVSVPFLRSKYRVTVERVPESDAELA